MEEREAIARLQRGDIGGLEPLVRAHYGPALRAAYLVTRDRALAEDVVQSAFLRAYERIGRFDARRPFRPWFLRSVVNGAASAMAQGRRQLSWERTTCGGGDEAAPLVDPGLGPDELLAGAETRREMWAALDQLPPAQRAAVVLRYYLDLGEAEMAEELLCPPGTVKWRLHAARKRLRALLQRPQLPGTP